MAANAARVISARGNDEGIPPGGQNPITEVTRKPPPLGQTISGQPASTAGFVQPSWFRAGGARGTQGSRTTSGRLGAPGPPPGGPGVVETIQNAQPNPELSTDYAFGWLTNAVLPYAKIAKRFRLPMIKAPQRHMLRVTMRDKKDMISTRRDEERRYTLLNIPAWNYHQARSEEMPATPEQVKTPDDVWSDWGIEGIVRTEEGHEDMSYLDERDKERVLNTVVRGYAFAYNTGGNRLRSGTKLYVVLKKKKLASSQEWSLNPLLRGDVPKPTAVSRATLTHMPFQLTFFADSDCDYPPDEVLQYKDEFGYRHRGKAIYIGFTEKGGAHNPNRRTTGSVDTSFQSILAQPQFFMFVDPDG